jgi:hypothetical protein
MSSLKLLSGILSLAILSSMPAGATLLTYSDSFVGSGSFDGVSFTDQLVTLSITADSTTAQNLGGGIFEIGGPLIVAVNGLGSADFADLGGVFVNNTTHVQTIDPTTNALAPAYDVYTSSSLSGYDLSTTFGPLVFTTASGPYGNGAKADTNLTIDSSSSVTFQVSAASSAVPEPASIGIMATGLILLLLLSRKRQYGRR